MPMTVKITYTIPDDYTEEFIKNDIEQELSCCVCRPGDDYAMVVVAEDERHAERKARWSSDNFKRAKKIDISQVSLDTESVILKANVGG